jgi:hypothetical protein
MTAILDAFRQFHEHGKLSSRRREDQTVNFNGSVFRGEHRLSDRHFGKEPQKPPLSWRWQCD